MKKNNAMQFFQKLSKAFLTPLALIASASLVMGIASFFLSADITGNVSFLQNDIVKFILTLFMKMGTVVTSNFPVIYAIALPFGLVDDNKEYAAFAGFIGYASFLTGMGSLIETFPSIYELFPENSISTILGIETVNTGLLGGIIVGILTSIIHKKFKNVQLPMALSFFSGLKLVPIMSVFIFMLLGSLFPFVWVYISLGISALAQGLGKIGLFGPFIYGVVERLLIPTGLHQLWISIVRDTSVSGVYEFASGVIEGQRPAFMAYLAEGLPSNASLADIVKFSYGPQIPMMLGGLPAIGLAIYQSAREDQKKYVKPLIISAVMTAVIAGISEPLEFIFLFIAPLLYVAYAILYGLSWVLMNLLGSQIGYGSGIIEFIVFGVLRSDSKWWICVAVIIIEFVFNYILFKWAIVKFNIKTPGRGGEYDQSLAVIAETNADGENVTGSELSADSLNPRVIKAQNIIKGLGGVTNIIEVDSCMSRLRVRINEADKIDEELLKQTGCSGIIKPSQNDIQIVYGTTVGMIKESVLKELKK
ncbi:PTS transporter subunit EIIC [Enterococcus faecium]